MQGSNKLADHLCPPASCEAECVEVNLDGVKQIQSHLEQAERILFCQTYFENKIKLQALLDCGLLNQLCGL